MHVNAACVSFVPFFLYLNLQFIPKCAKHWFSQVHAACVSRPIFSIHWFPIYSKMRKHWNFPRNWPQLIPCNFLYINSRLIRLTCPCRLILQFCPACYFFEKNKTIFCLEAISRSRSCKSIAQTTRLHQSRGNSILPRKKLHQPIGHIPASSYSIRSRYCCIRLVRRQTHEVVVFVLVSHFPFGFKLACSITTACVEGGLHVCSCNAFAGDPEDERWEKWYTKSKFSVFFFRTLLDLSTQQMTTTVAIQVSENT